MRISFFIIKSKRSAILRGAECSPDLAVTCRNQGIGEAWDPGERAV